MPPDWRRVRLVCREIEEITMRAGEISEEAAELNDARAAVRKSMIAGGVPETEVDANMNMLERWINACIALATNRKY